ncbi:MAG: DUF1573 domain-containing protein [Cyclobacteriaceae bacterium]
MKRLSLIALLFGLLAASSSYAQQIDFTETTVDYGEIARNADGVREFTFTNTGDAPLLISSARGSCGCTVPSFPREPIEPGASNVIKVKYDTNRIGAFTKYVTLTTNALENPTVRLTIRGVVKPSEPNAGGQ